MRLCLWLPLLMAFLLALPALAAPPAKAPAAVPGAAKPPPPPKPIPVAGKSVTGKPSYEVDKAVGFYLWTDDQGIHIRWTTDKKPVLFSGRLDLDRPLKELKRITDNRSGWAKNNGERIVMFSTTSRGGEDGIDLTVPGCKKLLVDLKIEGDNPPMEQVNLGEKLAHPTGFPMAIAL